MDYSKERWKTVAHSRNYAISSFGRVRRVRGKNAGRLLSPYKRSRYRYVNLSERGVPTKTNVHRLVAEAFLKNPNNYPCVNHKDGEKHNNHADNLEWCTYPQNTNHAFTNGLNVPKRIISKRVVDEIRNGDFSDMSQSQIAKSYGISQSQVSRILSRKTRNLDESLVATPASSRETCA